MRLAGGQALLGQKHIVDGINLKAQPWMNKPTDTAGGYTYNKRNGAASLHSATDPVAQLERLKTLGANPQDYFKQAKQIGIDPADGVLKGKSGPDLPGRKEKKEKKDKKGK